ncbi:hypothetical protein OKW34_003966 [Paraburkholderia youngii]|uniref:hypothetical protein n=1 Tax=Paraburkholderia youngii TaxID=2782701 RepID=UPI003D262FC9
MSSAPRGIARFDSAAAMVGALGACLHGKPFSSPSGSPLLDRSMPLINLLPRFAREWAYSIGGATEAIGERAARRLDIETIATWLADRYPRRQYPAAFVGSSNGALVHLAAAMGVPWLPQTFLCPVRAPGSDPDDAAAGLRDGRHAREALLAADGRIAVHHMHDPNQDRLMLRTMSYYRIKQRALALGFREFLLRSLPAGATLYVAYALCSGPSRVSASAPSFSLARRVARHARNTSVAARVCGNIWPVMAAPAPAGIRPPQMRSRLKPNGAST